jgi:hypothetical protein
VFPLFAPFHDTIPHPERPSADVHLKPTVGPVIELDVLFSPNLFEHLDRLTARFGIARFQFVNCPLGKANSSRKLGLTPTEHGTSSSDFGCESALSALNNLATRATGA